MVGGLGNISSLIITNDWGECSHQHQGPGDEIADSGFISLDAVKAMLRETYARISQQTDGLQHRIRDDRLEDIEFEMPLAASDRYGGVIAEYPRTNHCKRFALCRIDLAWHDRRARLVFRQDQFAQARARARSEQAYVVCDLEQAGGYRVE